MVDFKITKKEKLYEQNNDMAHNYYYLIHGRIYNKEKTKYRKFKYVEWFDIFDVQEYFDKEWIGQEDIKEYLNELENTYLVSINDFNDTKHLKEFYKFCNKTIEDYNNLAKHWIW